MLLGFKKQFACFVEEGSKTHTMRAKRKIRPRVGETCHCYTGLRQKGARLLGRWVCVRVQEVKITLLDRLNLPLTITVDGVLLDPGDTEMFLFRDGFRLRGNEQYGPIREAAEFWQKENGLKPGDTWNGDLIHWNYLQPAAAPKGKR